MTSPEPAEQLTAFLAQRRWFAGKGRRYRVTHVHPMAWLSAPGDWPAVRIELVTVAYDDPHARTSTEIYQLPLAYYEGEAEHLAHAAVGSWEIADGGPMYAYDALHDKAAAALLLRGLVDARRTSDLTFREADGAALAEEGASLVLGIEQSNTSVVFGDGVLMKVFRRVVPGVNPDIEVHAVLTRRGCDEVAPLLGWLEGRWPLEDGRTVTGHLAMFQQFIRTATGGWELAIASVRDLYAEGDLHADEVGGDFAGEAERLGATTAGVHAEMAAALTTSLWGREELTRLAHGMRARLEAAVDEVPELAPFADALRKAYADVAGIDGLVPAQRVHGDFHLGQTMRTARGWMLLDFEGEPERPLAERVRQDSPVRDIAGMLRSFDYAARHLLADHPGNPQIAYRANEWASRNRDAFCVGYASVCGVDPRERPRLLRAYETDKAVYEVVYEARNRPAWLAIPLAAIERLAR